MITDVTNISLYESLWVKPQIASVVITAPLWGSVSSPPEAKDAILCIISGEILSAWLIDIKVGAKASSVIVSPPEADAVIPQIIFTDKASDIIGLDDKLSITDCKVINTGNDFITLPYPTIALELSRGKKELYIPYIKKLLVLLLR